MDESEPAEVISRFRPLDLTPFIGQHLPVTRFKLWVESKRCDAMRPASYWIDVCQGVREEEEQKRAKGSG